MRCGPTLLAILICTIYGTCRARIAIADEQVSLREWHSTNGHVSKGLYWSYDEKSGTVTILLPKKIPISKLSKTDQEYVREHPNRGYVARISAVADEFAEEAAAVAKSARVAAPRKWLEGGTLHDKGALDWQKASPHDKLATCADFISTMWTKGHLKPDIQDSIKSVDDIKPYAFGLVQFLDSALKRDPDSEANRRMYANQQVKEVAALGMVMMKWTK